MITVILPTYNEAGNIKKLIGQLDQILPPQSTVLIVDDSSSDGTGDIVKNLTTNNKIHVITRPKKSGLGTALIEGMQYALDDGSELIISMDADLSHNPNVIKDMIDQSQKFNQLIIVGSRYVSEGFNRNSLRRVCISKFSNFLISLLLNIKCRDATSGFRMYPRIALESIDLKKIQSTGYSFQWEILYLLSKEGYSTVEIPIDFGNRYMGKSKLDLNEIAKATFMLVTFFLKHGCSKKSIQANSTIS